MNIIRWIGRILTVFSVAFILTFFIGEADFSQPVQLSVRDIVMLLFFPVGLIAGNVVGWWKEGWGALITAISLALFYLADLVFTGTFPGGPFFALLASPALFYGLYWFLSRSNRAEFFPENTDATS